MDRPTAPPTRLTAPHPTAPQPAAPQPPALAYEEALAALTDRGRFGIRLGLGRTRALLRALGDPQLGLRGALAAGTNGKGSVLALAGSALRAAGRDAGLELVQMTGANYFGSAKRSNRIYQRLERIVPPTLRAGITVIYRRPPNDT